MTETKPACTSACLLRPAASFTVMAARHSTEVADSTSSPLLPPRWLAPWFLLPDPLWAVLADLSHAVFCPSDWMTLSLSAFSQPVMLVT